MGAPIDFYFDFISPYAHLAFPEVIRLSERFERPLVPKPIVFGAILDHHGQLGPAEIPAKRTYTFKNVLRLAAARGRALTPPPTHPFNPLLSLRVCLAVEDPDARVRLVGKLFSAVWGPEGPGVTDGAEIARLADEVGLPGARLVRAAGDASVKQALKSMTAEAIARDVFGVPTIIVDGELFWGLDAMPHVAQFLAGNDPFDPAALERWRDLPVGIQRKRRPPGS